MNKKHSISLENIVGQVIKNILVMKTNANTNGYDKVVFLSSSNAFEISVDEDTDELKLQEITENYRVHKKKFQTANWASSYIEGQITGLWRGKNNLGYFDLLCIGVNEFIPTIIMCSIASEIKVTLANYSLS